MKKKKEKNIPKKEELDTSAQRVEKEPYNPTRYGDWLLKNGKCVDF